MSRIVSEGGLTHSARLFDRFEWKLQDFFDKSVGTVVESPDFRYDYAIWHLAIGTNKNSTAPVVFLNLWRTKSSGSRYLVRVGTVNKNGKDCDIVSCETDTDGFLEVRKFLPWVENLQKNNNKLVSGKCLTVFCEISPSAKGKEESPKLVDMSTSLLKQNLKDLIVSGVNSDVEIHVADRTFKAHKAILSARCPVFSSMFQCDMQENSSGVVNIPDCSANAFSMFLHYLYTGEVDDSISECICDLYYIADKYNVKELKEHCVKFLKIDLSVDNFCDVVTLALRHSEFELLETSCSFFTTNVKVIIETVRWQQYLKENPIHANELFIKAINC